MKKLSIFTVCAIAVLSSCLINSCNAHRIYYQDSDLAASDQKCKCYCNKGKDTGMKGKDTGTKGKDVGISEKGEDSDYHDYGFDKHGKKGKKGYDMNHRYSNEISI